MSLYLKKNHDSDSYNYVGKRYQKDYDILQSYKEIELRLKINELIELETNLTLLEELENKKNPAYSDFINALRLKRKIKFGY